jgi:hypothetical protein
MQKKHFLTLAAVLIGAALIGLAGWGFSRPAVASPGHGASEGTSLGAKANDEERVTSGEHRYVRRSDRDERHDAEDPRDGHEGDDGDDDGDSTGAAPGGTTTTAGATTTTLQGTTTTTQAPATTSTTSINAAPLFSSLCASCHGPTPIRSTLTSAQILTTISTGSMSGYASSLNAAQLSALASYIAGGGR